MRKYTTMVMDMMDEGVMTAQAVADMCLAYMSEDDVKDMCLANDILLEEDSDNEVYNAYEDGECPDCGTRIPRDVADGDNCSNCDHVFTTNWEDDEWTPENADFNDKGSRHHY